CRIDRRRRRSDLEGRGSAIRQARVRVAGKPRGSYAEPGEIAVLDRETQQRVAVRVKLRFDVSGGPEYLDGRRRRSWRCARIGESRRITPGKLGTIGAVPSEQIGKGQVDDAERRRRTNLGAPDRNAVGGQRIERQRRAFGRDPTARQPPLAVGR